MMTDIAAPCQDVCALPKSHLCSSPESYHNTHLCMHHYAKYLCIRFQLKTTQTSVLFKDHSDEWIWYSGLCQWNTNFAHAQRIPSNTIDSYQYCRLMNLCWLKYNFWNVCVSFRIFCTILYNTHNCVILNNNQSYTCLK